MSKKVAQGGSGQKRKRGAATKAHGQGWTEQELHKLTVAELKEQLRSRTLPVSGVKKDLIARLLAPTDGRAPSVSSSAPSSCGWKKTKAELERAGVSAEDIEATDLAKVQKLLNGYVRDLAKMVNEDWHDGWEYQSEEVERYYHSLAGIAQSVYNIAEQGTGFEHCHEVMKAMADSWANMLTIPMRLDIEEVIQDTTIELANKQERVWGVPDLVGLVWRELLVAAAKAGVSDESMWRYIKDASDNSVNVTDFEREEEKEDEDDEDDEDDDAAKATAEGRARLVELYNNKEKWTGLPTNLRVHKQRRCIDRRFDGPVNRRTRDYHLWDTY